MAEYGYYITRMDSLPLSMERIQKEWTTIQNITKANNFVPTLTQN